MCNPNQHSECSKREERTLGRGSGEQVVFQGFFLLGALAGLAGEEVGFPAVNHSTVLLKPGAFAIAVNWLPLAPAAWGAHDRQP